MPNKDIQEWLLPKYQKPSVDTNFKRLSNDKLENRTYYFISINPTIKQATYSL